MMKRNILAVVIPALLVAGAANAAEIYNKNSNKLDFYGKAVGNTSGRLTVNLITTIPPMPVSVSKVKPRLTTN